MVQRKGGKYGLHTSRTLKKTPYFMKPRIFYNSQFVLSKFVERGRGQHITFNEQFQDFLDDGSIPVAGHTPSHVLEFPEFSINKRKRWLLPKLLQNAIEESDGIDELPFRVCLVERAIQSRVPVDDDFSLTRFQMERADCLSVIRSKSVKRRLKPKKKYSFETALHGDRVRRGGGIEHVIEEDSQERPLPELTYEVCYPRPKTSYPAYSPLLSRTNRRLVQKKKLRKSKGKMREVRLQGISSTIHSPEELQHLKGKCSVEILKEEENYLDCGQTELDQGFDKVPPDRDQIVSLSDYFTCINKKVSQKERRRRHLNRVVEEAQGNLFKNLESGKRKPKGSAIFDPTIPLKKTPKLTEPHSPSEDSGFSDGSDIMFNFDFLQDSIWKDVKLDEASLSELHLSRTFGESLMGFAESDPFCVAINLCRTDFKEEVSPQKSRLEEVVLLIQKLEREDDSILCRFKLCDLRAVTTGERVNSSMVITDREHIYTTQDLVRVILQALSSSLEYEADTKPRLMKSKHSVTLETVTRLLDWKYQSKPERDILELIRYEEETSSARSFCSYQPCRTQPPEFCEICYDDISDIDGSTPLSTALRECSHWFCGHCWQQHVTSRTQQGDVNIKCPAHDCNSPVDTITLLALLPDSFLPLFSRLRLNQLLSGQKLWEWCQNPKCSRMVRVEGARSQHIGDDQMNVIRCACGHSWCHGCKEEAHWPVTCQQAAEYKSYVESKGVDHGEELITTVEVKRCPDCDYPIDKNGGCMHMRCHFCHHQFCWECLSPWEGHMTNWTESCNFQPLETISLSGKKTMSVEMYLKEAVRLRKERQSSNAVSSAALHCGMCMYYQYLKTLSGCHPQLTFRTYNLFHSEYSTTWIASEAHAAEFLKILRLCERACSLCREITFVLEHLNVLIATSKTKYLRRRCSGWKDTVDKLSFISNRLHRMITGQTELKYPHLGEHMQRLVNAGELRLKEVVKAIPRVHNTLAVKDKISQRNKSEC